MTLRTAIRDRLLSRPAVLAAHVVGLLALSRILTATDFGLFAIAAIAHQMAVSLADLGIKAQLLKSTVLEPRRHGEALGLALLSAAIVGTAFVCVILLLPDSLVPRELNLTFWILAAAVFIGPLDLLFNIPLMQSMRFGLISGVNILGAWTRCLVSIAFALKGAGPASLAAGLLAEQVVSFALFAFFRRSETMPRPRASGWRDLLGDGVRLGGSQFIRYMSEMGMVAAISGFLGVAAMGVFNRADRIVKLFDSVFLTSLTPIVLPAFAQAIDNGHQPAAIYLRKVELLSALTWPAFAMIAILADPLCRVVLGPGWPTAPVIVQLLALLGIAKPFTKMSQHLFIALGDLRLGARLDGLHHITRASLAAIGALVSLEAVCIGLLMAQFINAGRQTSAFGRSTGYSHRTLLWVLLRSALLTVSAVLPAMVAVNAVHMSSDVMSLVVAAFASALGFTIAAVAMRHTLFQEAQRAIGILRARRRS